MTRILLTGAAGFIGSHLAETLLHRDYSVIGIDNLLNRQYFTTASQLLRTGGNTSYRAGRGRAFSLVGRGRSRSSRPARAARRRC